MVMLVGGGGEENNSIGEDGALVIMFMIKTLNSSTLNNYVVKGSTRNKV